MKQSYYVNDESQFPFKASLGVGKSSSPKACYNVEKSRKRDMQEENIYLCWQLLMLEIYYFVKCTINKLLREISMYKITDKMTRSYI